MKRYEKEIKDYALFLAEDDENVRKRKLEYFASDIKSLAESGECNCLLLDCHDCPMFGKNCVIKQGTEIREYLNEEIE